LRLWLSRAIRRTASAPVATTVTMTGGFLLVLYFASSLVSIDFDVRATVVIVAAALTMYVILLVVSTQVSVDSIPGLLGIICFGGAVYLGLVLTYQPFRSRVISAVRPS